MGERVKHAGGVMGDLVSVEDKGVLRSDVLLRVCHSESGECGLEVVCGQVATQLQPSQVQGVGGGGSAYGRPRCSAQ